MDVICYLYIPDFPAWAVRYAQPEIQRTHRGIGVYERDAIVARSRRLRRRGLEIGQSLDRAQMLFPHACFLPIDYDQVRVVWKEVVNQTFSYTPYVEVIAPGHLCFRTPDEREAAALASKLKAKIGIAEARSIACIAAHRAGRGAMLKIRPEMLSHFLDKTSSAILLDLGFSEELLEKVGLFGLATLGRLSGLTQKQVLVQFPEEGERLHQMLHPDLPERPVRLYMPPREIEREHDIEHPSTEPAVLIPILDHLVRDACMEMGYLATRLVAVSITDKKTGDTTKRSRMLREPTMNVRMLCRVTEHLLLLLLNVDVRVMTVGITFGWLKSPDQKQGGLFFRRPEMQPVVTGIHERFPGAMMTAVVRDPGAAFHEDISEIAVFEPPKRGAKK